MPVPNLSQYWPEIRHLGRDHMGPLTGSISKQGSYVARAIGTSLATATDGVVEV